MHICEDGLYACVFVAGELYARERVIDASKKVDVHYPFSKLW